MEEIKGVNPSESPTEEPKPEAISEDVKTPEQPPKLEGKQEVGEKTVPENAENGCPPAHQRGGDAREGA